MGKTSKRTWGRSGLLTQWIIKYGYLPIILIGMVGLALDIGTREWKSDDVIVADAPVVAETFVERVSRPRWKSRSSQSLLCN
ncbi:MAG: hypothetical protein WCA25_19335 [Pseudolabrys sp.]